MKKHTYYHLVLDHSGSMDSCWTEAKQSFQTQLLGFREKQNEYADQELFFSYCAFNQALNFSEGVVPIAKAAIDWSVIYPNGMTSLYDAIGSSIQFLKSKLDHQLASEHTDVVMLILTDGHENSSRIYNAQAVRNLINRLELSGKWTFLFLGAGLNVEEATRDLDRKGKNSMSFKKSNMMSSLGSVTKEINEFMELKSRGQKKETFFINDSDTDLF